MIFIYLIIAVVILVLTVISFNLNRKLFNMGTTIFTALFSFVAIVAFWYFIYRGDVYDNWYPLVGHFIAAHGAFFGVIIWQILENKGISFSEWIKSILEKIK